MRGNQREVYLSGLLESVSVCHNSAHRREYPAIQESHRGSMSTKGVTRKLPSEGSELKLHLISKKNQTIFESFKSQLNLA